MYQDFYRLSADPFRLTPDPLFCFHHQAFTKAWAYMRYALEVGEGFIVVTGQPGTGKTTLTETLIDNLKQSRFITHRLVGTHLEANDLLRNIAYAFNIDAKRSDRATLVRGIQQYLITQNRSNRRVLLIVDEAQGVPDAALEELRLLADMQISGTPLIQVFLLGQDQLHRVLDTPELEQFKQRIIAACHLTKLNLQETRDFIEHRLNCAGWRGNPQFSGRTILSIHRHSHGLPRHINKLCSRLILRGYTEEKHVLGEKDVLAIVSELDDEKLTPLDYEEDFYAQEGTIGGETDSEPTSTFLDKLAIHAPKAQPTGEATTRSRSKTGLSPAGHGRDIYTPTYADLDARDTVPNTGASPHRHRRRRRHKNRTSMVPGLAPLFSRALRSGVEHAKTAGRVLKLEVSVGRLRGLIHETVHRGSELAHNRDWARSAVTRGIGYSSKLSGVARTLSHQVQPKWAIALVATFLIAAMVFATLGINNLQYPKKSDPLLAEKQDVSADGHKQTAAMDAPASNRRTRLTVEPEEAGVERNGPVEDLSMDSKRQIADLLGGPTIAVADDLSPTLPKLKDTESNTGTKNKRHVVVGRVLHDLDGDSLDDKKGYRNVPGVSVELRDAKGDVIASTVTGSDGNFRFGDVRDGNYAVVVPDVKDVLVGYTVISGSLEMPVTVNLAVKEPIDWFGDEQRLFTTDAHHVDTGTETARGATPPLDDCFDAAECGSSANSSVSSDIAMLQEDADAAGTMLETSTLHASPLVVENQARPHHPAVTHMAASDFEQHTTTKEYFSAQTITSAVLTLSPTKAVEMEGYPSLTILPAVSLQDHNTGSSVDEGTPRLSDPPQNTVPALLSAAQLALEDKRLSIPGDNSAFYYYQKILAIDPENAAASAGIGRVAERYIKLATDALDRALDEKAQRYIARGLRVDPGHSGLLALREYVTVTMAEAEMRKSASMIEAELPPPVPVEKEPVGLLQRFKSYFDGDSEPSVINDNQ